MTTMSNEQTPGNASQFELGEIARDFTDVSSGLRGLVMRGGLGWCGYVGAPNEHPLNGIEELKFRCHFGVNFAQQGEDTLFLPHGYYWWGWDYAHFSDMPILPEHLEALEQWRLSERGLQRKVWTVDEVAEEVMDVLMSLRVAIEENSQLAEIALKKATPVSGNRST